MRRDFGLFLVVLFFMVFNGAVIGASLSSLAWKREATRMGVAEFRYNPKTGRTEFMWIKPGEQAARHVKE